MRESGVAGMPAAGEAAEPRRPRPSGRNKAEAGASAPEPFSFNLTQR